MKREAIVRAAYYMCLALGKPTSRREVSAMIEHNLGKSFRPDFITSIIKTLVGNHLGTTEEPRQLPQLVPETSLQGTTTLAAPKPATYKRKVINIASLRSAAVPHRGENNHRPPRLPLDAEVQVARRAILTAIWSLLEATPYAATVTKTEWGKCNSRVALDLAEKHISPERCVEAWQAATTRLGSPVRLLKIVQDELGRIATPKIPEKSAPRYQDWTGTGVRP